MDPTTVTLLCAVGIVLVLPLVLAGVYYAKGLLPVQKPFSKLRQPKGIGEANLLLARALVDKTIAHQSAREDFLRKFDTEVNTKEAKIKPVKSPIRLVTMEELVARLERRVEERERLSKEPLPPVLSPATEAKIDAFADRIKSLPVRAEVLLQHPRRLFRVVDRDIDRAYLHLCQQVSEAHEAGAVADMQHADLEREAARASLRLCQPGECADEDSIVELTNAMVVLRRRNFLVGEALFRIDRVVRRLYVVKLLLRALPSGARGEVAQFRSALNAVSDYLDNVWAAKGEPSTNDLYARIEHLEHRTLTVYIRLAKNKKQRPSAQERLARAIRHIIESLDEVTTDEKQLHDEWNERALAAETEGKKLIYAVSKLRKEQCEIVLHSLERTTRVLDAVCAAFDETTERRRSI